MAELLAAIENFASGHALTFVLSLAAVGTISMALIQVVKELAPVRRWYQKRWLTAWLARQIAKAEPIEADLPAASPDLVRDALVELATGGDERAMFDLSADQMVAQMNAAAQMALDYPQLNKPLLRALSAGASRDDLMLIFLLSSPDEEASPSSTFNDARNRVGHRLQRNLDGLMIALGNDWRWWMHFCAIGLTILLVEAAAISYGLSASQLLLAAFIGLIGGYLAPIARDLVAALQSLRLR